MRRVKELKTLLLSEILLENCREVLIVHIDKDIETEKYTSIYDFISDRNNNDYVLCEKDQITIYCKDGHLVLGILVEN